MQASEKVSHEFVVAGGNGSKVLEFVAEALGEVALAIEGKSQGNGALRRRWEGITGVIRRLLKVSPNASASYAMVDLVPESAIADLGRRPSRLAALAPQGDGQESTKTKAGAMRPIGGS